MSARPGFRPSNSAAVPPLGEKTPLHRLANTTGGSYFYIDVSQFPRTDVGY